MGYSSGHSRLTTFVVAALIAATVVLVPAGPASAAATTCGGRQATIIGTSGADVIVGTPGPDVIVGRGGNDIIRGKGGNDIICGNKGRDRIYGGPGADILYGNSGQDLVKGNSGHDRVFGGSASDTVSGGKGDDILKGGSGKNDRLFGNSGFDVCTESGLVEPAGCDHVTNDPIDPECQDADANGFHLPTAQDMIQLASMAYAVDPGWDASHSMLDQGTAESDLDPPDLDFLGCWELIDSVESGGTQGYVARNTQTEDIVVAFRGTESSVADWLTDAQIFKQDWVLPDGSVVRDSVHTGFKNSYQSVDDQIRNILDDHDRSNVPGARVYFTGHSLGGALATLASLDLADDIRDMGYANNDVVLYTFGAPRAITRRLLDHHRSWVPNGHALVNAEDSVPHVPTATGVSNEYTHIRNMVAINEVGGQVWLDRGDGSGLNGCLNGQLEFGHARDRYQRRLSATHVAPNRRVWGTNDDGNMRMNWSGLEGPCDRIALFYNAGIAPRDLGDQIGASRSAVLDTNNTHRSATVDVGSDIYVGWINIFDEIELSAEYRRATPNVWLDRSPFGWVRINWTMSDEGDQDYVRIYASDPRAGATPISGLGNSERVVTDTDNQHSTSERASSRSTWWVAYVEEDAYGGDRILDVYRWDR